MNENKVPYGRVLLIAVLTILIGVPLMYLVEHSNAPFFFQVVAYATILTAEMAALVKWVR